MSQLVITRVINACVLMELPDGGAILTDPFFEPPWYLKFDEPVGVTADQLPPLTVLLGGHRVTDHWQPGGLRSLPNRDRTAVYVVSRGMARRARRAGFTRIEELEWGQRRRAAPDLEVTCLPGERAGGLRTNSYLVSYNGTNVFIGTEARTLDAIRATAAEHHVDVAILPINGIRLLGRPLVMDAATALEAAHLLGAEVFIPIHYSQRALRPLLRPTSGVADITLTGSTQSRMGSPSVVVLEPGERRVLAISS